MTIQEYGIVAAISTAILTGCRFVFVKFKEQQSKYRNKLNGNWTNEGSVGGKPETHYINLTLTVDNDDGAISGIINSRHVSSSDEIQLSVTGRIIFQSAYLDFIKISQGRISHLARTRISLKGHKNLGWSIIEDYNNFFPKKTVLWKSTINFFQQGR